jgi:hypothetical protein
MNGYTMSLIFLLVVGIFLAGLYVGHNVGMKQTVLHPMNVSIVNAPAKIETLKTIQTKYITTKAETVKGNIEYLSMPAPCPQYIAHMDTTLNNDTIHVQYQSPPRNLFNLTVNRPELPVEVREVDKAISLWLKTTLSGYNESSAQMEVGYQSVGLGVQWIRAQRPNYTISFTKFLFR